VKKKIFLEHMLKRVVVNVHVLAIPFLNFWKQNCNYRITEC